MLVAGLMLFALIVSTHEDNKLFYVAPNLQSNQNCSHNQPCLTFQQFINSTHSQENATLVFLTGRHTLTEGQRDPVKLLFYTNLEMVGISTEVIIHDIAVIFFDVQELHIENLTLYNGFYHMVGTSQLSLFSVTAINFAINIYAATLAKLHNCKFSNGINQLFIIESNVMFSGNSKLFNNQNSALVAYSSTIILSGTVSFANNSGVRGGAMALHSSTVYLRSGLNVSFINNSAQEIGGAIYIEPDMTQDYCPDCFYKSQVYDPVVKFYYYENSAQFGGNNIYGTSLSLCVNYDKIRHHFLPTVSMSSVSSNPTQVCLCDSDDQPQCKNAPETLTSKNVHPGETIIIPAVIVGGDYGTTTGTVHASFMPDPMNISVPVLEASHQ